MFNPCNNSGTPNEAEEYIKEEIKIAFDYQNKANKLFNNRHYTQALDEYKKVKKVIYLLLGSCKVEYCEL